LRSPHQRAASAALLVAFAAIAGCASAPDAPPPLTALETPLPLRARPADVFVPGETLTYDVSFGPFLVGEMVYRVEGARLGARDALRFEGVTRARGLFAAFARAGGTTRSLVDAETLLPDSAVWIDARRDDPMTRAACFDRGTGEARCVAFQSGWLETKVHRGATFFDAVSAMFLLRALEPAPEGDERRLVMVEGTHLHLLTVRLVGREPLAVGDETEPRPALKLSVRGDRLNDAGGLKDERPQNDFHLWLADTPRREPLRLAGRIAVGGVDVRWRPPPPDPSPDAPHRREDAAPPP